jgi:Rrf2 family protein
MFNVTRKVEYALIGISHIAAQPAGTIVTVREVAEHYNIPAKLLAKVFHELKSARLLRSHQGKNGGYSLAHLPSEVTLAQIVDVIEGQSKVVICFDSEGYQCPQHDHCNIVNPMEQLNHRLRKLLESVTLREFIANKGDMWSSHTLTV